MIDCRILPRRKVFHKIVDGISKRFEAREPMNIFVLDEDIYKCARYHCDKHVVKMILEYTQLLCTTIHVVDGEDAPEGIYRKTHMNHPCAKWARESRANWLWLQALTLQLNNEFKRRFKGKSHKSALMAKSLNCPINLLDKPMTPFALAMPDECKIIIDGKENAVESYRNYYMTAKTHLLNWYGLDEVPWIVEPQRG